MFRNRIREGYDLRGDVIERAAVAGIRLVISVDAGLAPLRRQRAQDGQESTSLSPIIICPGGGSAASVCCG